MVEGAVGNALSYGTSTASGKNYATLGTPEDLNFGTDVDFSLSFWVKHTTVNGDPVIIGNKDWGSGSNPGFLIGTQDDGRLEANIGPDRQDVDATEQTLNDGGWHHVAASFDRDGSGRFYVDGLEIAAVDLSTAARDLNAAGLPLNIGEDGTGGYSSADGSRIEDGTIDDLGIWRRVLTADEVWAIYDAGAAGVDLSGAAVGNNQEGDSRRSVGLRSG